MTSWLMPLAALATVLVGGFVALQGLRLARRHDREVARRLDLAVGRTAAPPPKPTARADLLQRRTLWQRIRDAIRAPFLLGVPYRWGITLPAPLALAMTALAAALSWLFLERLLHLPLWFAIPGAVLAAPQPARLLMQRQQRVAEDRFLEHFPDVLDMIVRTVRSGLPVASAIRMVAAEAPAPLSAIFKRVADRSDIGVALETALADTSDEVGVSDFRFLAVTVALQRATGGNLARTLEASAEFVRRRRALRIKSKSVTAEVRLSAWVLASMPFAAIGALLLINPGYLLPLVADPRGNVLLGIATLCLGAGLFSMRWLVRHSMH